MLHILAFQQRFSEFCCFLDFIFCKFSYQILYIVLLDITRRYLFQTIRFQSVRLRFYIGYLTNCNRPLVYELPHFGNKHFANGQEVLHTSWTNYTRKRYFDWICHVPCAHCWFDLMHVMVVGIKTFWSLKNVAFWIYQFLTVWKLICFA